ncbi:hypothetical protein ACA087_06275 [Pseudomonas chlororaphis]|uniref:hypothetical protein n=1 Tax=Pseudomonas chlororaphis TaxID=587753 RepID=UPI00352BAC17
MKKPELKQRGLPIIHNRVAGIDISLRFYVVAVPADLAKESVPFTADLVHLGITTVTMKSTHVYWIPVYEILKTYDLQMVLANAREALAVSGGKPM